MSEVSPYSELRQVHQNLEAMSKMVAGLENDILDTLKEDTELRMKNQFLREKLGKLAAEKAGKEVKGQSDLASLRKIYESGYRICNMYYGTHRNPSSDCMFCLDILDNFEHKGKGAGHANTK